MGLKGIIFAIEAGSCAAMASVSAKLAASSETAISLSKMAISWAEQIIPLEFLHYEYEVAIILRVAGISGIFLFNALMWVLFTKSMHLCSSALEATAFNTSSNFITTAIIGKLLFGEHLSLLWYLGSSLIIFGLTILHSASKDQETDQQNQDKIEQKEKVL
ncbi:unnamed protein product [Lymnaea stagnalis]|uniref:EamA domain-containing protein n=1 Tax=Lymnaea stagnalis TaxID=6523 RepID=A0AAV2H3G7_LYMST